MRSVSLSKYLSKSVHLFTIFVYLFTFLGPSLALATHARTYAETVYGETVTTPLRASGLKTQEEQFINISKGWGAQSLYFGIGQDVQHLVSPLSLSRGELPYEEVIEQGLSLGFKGTLEDFGQFFCCWDGRLLINGDYSKGRPPSRFISSLENESSLTDEAVRALLTPYLKKEVKIDEDDEWSCYSSPLVGANLNDTFKVHLEKRIKAAWHDLANRLQGAFLPLITSLGLDQKADWDLKDYINVVSKSAAFLRKYKTTKGADLEESLAFLNGHLNASSLDPYTTKWIVLQDEMAEEVLALWTQLAQNIGDDFTNQAKRSELDDVTFLSFQTLASFVDDFLSHIEKTTSDRRPYSRDIPSLFLDTFAPVTFSNFIAKSVKATAERIFFRGDVDIEEATLTPTTLSDLEAFCQVSVGSSAVIKDLILTNGVMTNLGDFEGKRATIGRQASFVNGGKAHIQDLRGQGLFMNHGHFKGLVRTSILRFINQTNTFFAPQAESHFENVSVAGVTSQFLNDEGALLEAKKITFEENKLFPSDAVGNKGTFVVHEGITLKGRDFVNGGDATLPEIDLHDAKVINEEHQTISGVRSLKLSGNSTVKNAGTFETKGVVAYDIFKLLANQEQGHWEHQGDVELDEEETAITGSVSLNNGFFIGDKSRGIVSSGALKLHDFSQSNELFFIENEGQMVISGLRKDTPQFSFMIANKHGASLLLTENQGPPLGSFSIDNSGEVELSSSNGLTHWIYNGLSGRVSFKKGIYRLGTFLNRGKVDFEASNWHVGQESLRNSVVFASDEFVEEANFLDHVNIRPGTNVEYQIFSGIVFPKNLTFRLPYSLGQIEVGGYLHLPLLQSARPRTLEDLKDVTCHGKTHIALKEFTLTENLTFEKLRSLHITCSEAIKIQARLQALQIFINGQKGFDLGVDNDHFGEVVATSGRLGITVQDALNAKYGRLYSMQKMHLRSKTDRVDIGEMASKSNPIEGGYYTTYAPNDSFVSTNGGLHVYAAKGGSNKSLVWVGGNFHIEIPDPDSGQPDFPFENIAGHIIVWGDANLDLKAMYNKRMPYYHRVLSIHSGAYREAYHDKVTSRAAQFHVQGDLKTHAPTFHNISSLVRVVGNFTGDAERLYADIQQGGTGTGWRNIKEVLSRNARHKKEGWHCHSNPPFNIEPQITGIFSVGGDFLPPSYLTFFENSGVIEARLAKLMIEGDIALKGHGPLGQTPVKIKPLDTFVPKNGLFQKNTPSASAPSDPVIKERFPLGGKFSDAVSSAPRLIIPSLKTRRLLLEGGTTIPRQFPTFTRDYLSPSALSYVLLTGVIPLMPRAYQHFSPSQLLTTLQGNSVTFLKNLRLLKGSDPLYSLEGPTRAVPNNKTLILRDPTAFLQAPKITEPMMAFVEEEIEGEVVLVPYIALPPKDIESGVTRMDKEVEMKGHNLFATGALTESFTSYVDIRMKGGIVTQPYYETKRYNTEKRTTVTETIPHATVIRAAKGERLTSQGGQVHVGTKLKAGDEYEILIKAATAKFLAAHRTKETVTKKKKQSGYKKVKETKTTSESTPDVVEMEGGNIRVLTEDDIVDEASRIIAKIGIDFESKEGKILLKMAFKQFHHAVQRSSESAVWNRYKSEGRSSKTGVEGVKKAPKGKISMKASEIHQEHRADSALDDEFSHYLETQKNVIRHAIQDESDSWCDTTQSLGMVAVAAIVIVVTYFTAGSCSGLVAPLTEAGVSAGMSAGVAATVSTGVAAGMSAGVGAIASQALISMVNNGGDLGAVAKELTSSKAMKSLAISMLSAGLTAGTLDALDLGGTISGNVGEQLLSRTQEAAIRAGVNTVLKSTIEGRNFGEVLAEEARSGAANVVGSTMANKLGVEYKKEDSDINGVVHKIMHGVIGGISGLISGGTKEAFAAAIGATIGEIVGEGFEKAHQDDVYDPTHPSYNAKERKSMVRKGTMYAELSAAVFAGILGQDPNAAARAANTAVTENAFFIPVIIGSIALYEAYEVYQIYDKEGPEAAIDELIKIGVITAVTAGVGKVAFKVGAKLYPSAEAAFMAYKAQSPMLTKVAGKMTSGLDSTKAFMKKMARLGKGKAASSAGGMKLKRDAFGRVIGVEHTQIHHVLHQQLKTHPLWDKAGMNVESALNKMLLPTKEGATMSSTLRSIHEGRHLKHIATSLERQMRNVLTKGQHQGYSQSQYRAELVDIMKAERKLLKSGERALNKNKRPWADQ